MAAEPLSPPLTVAHLERVFPHARRANLEMHWPVVWKALVDYGLMEPRLVAFALGTIAAETAGFAPIPELPSRFNTDLEPFDKYDGRRALGNWMPGDGARYRGRGFVQLTGRENYRAYGEKIRQPLEDQPGMALVPEIAADLLAAFIADRKGRIKTALEAQDLAQARRTVNGGTHGLDRFTAAYKAALALLEGTS